MFEKIRYHGLFGVELLEERESGQLYLVDFNARSARTTAHYVAGGLNLPYLAYRELCGDDLSDQPREPEVRPVRWVDFWLCLGSYWRLRKVGRMNCLDFLRALLRSRAWAVWSWRDPGPALRHTAAKLRMALSKLTSGSN